MPKKAKQQLNGLKTNGGASEAPGLYQLYVRKRGTLSGGVVTGTPAEDETFLTNPTGNWSSYSIVTSGSLTLNQSRASNTVNEYTAISPSGPTGYDSNGNMTTMPQVDVWAAAQTLTYDAWNRPITVVQSGTTLGTYAYDGLNRRTTKTISGTTRDFYYSKDWQVLEERVSGSADRQYIWGTRYRDDLISRDRIGVDRLYSLADYFQTTSIANTSGVIQERYVYRAFGDVGYWNSTWTTSSSSSAYAWTYLYGGYQLDLETYLYQVRNRYYHSALGRWLSRDPLEDAAELSEGSNLYWYVQNNAVNKVDPSGLGTDGPPDCCDPCKAAQSSGLAGNSGGGVVCCNGKKTSCSWQSHQSNPPDTADKILDKCTKAHEDDHKPDVDCAGTGLSRPSFRDPSRQAQGEKDASNIEIGCLKKSKSDCNKDPDCIKRINDRIHQMRQYRNKF